MAEINIVPYVDVMLVLMVIFMVTAPLITEGVNVNLPKAQARVIPQKNTPPLIVSVDKDGRYYLNVAQNNKTPISSRDLTVRIAAELQSDPKRPVMVRGDAEVDYGRVMGAMVLLQQAGANSVGLMTAAPDDKA
jgi:biopolymer transport protein TolR